MSGPNGLQGSILILGDEEKSARALERTLSASGFHALSVADFDAARLPVVQGDVSLLILEYSASKITLSVMQPSDDDSGESLRRHQWAQAALRFCKGLRGEPAIADFPALVIARSQWAQDKVAFLDAGATDYITKPYLKTELLSRVKAHLRSGQYERERKERFEQLNVLHAASSALTSSLEPDVLVRGTLAVLVKHLHAYAGAVYLRQADSQTTVAVAAQGFPEGEEAQAGLLELHVRIAPLMNGAPLILEPLPQSVRAGLTGNILRDANGLVIAPVELQGAPVGAICLASARKSPMPRQYADLLATVCNQLSVALDNARLYVETKKTAARLSFVYNIGNHLMTSLEMDELLGYAVFTVGKSLECDVCGVIVRSEGQEAGFAAARYARSGDATEADSAEWFDVERLKHYFEVAGRSVHPPFETQAAGRLLTDGRVRGEVVVPLVFDDALVGVLLCASYAPRPFSGDDQKLLVAVAQQLSLAIRNTELFENSRDTSINLAVEVATRTKEIEEQKRFTEKIIDSLPVSLYVVDRDMRIVAWNRNREVGGQGMSREEVLGRNVFQVLARQPRRMLQDEFIDVFRNGQILRMEQESWMDGQKKVWNISKIPMRVDNAEVSHVITVGEDVTEQKKMNEAVIHAEKLASIGRLAAGVVHEINNPLATIAACAEALTSRAEDLQDEELHSDFSEYLQIIRDEAFRCKAITNSLLDFSHQRQAEKLMADLNQIIENTLQLIKHHPKLGKMRVRKELDETLGHVYVNEGQMKQIFIALIANAFDAMDSAGELTIRTSRSQSSIGRSLCAEFADTGCGIPPTHLPKIFDPFFTTKPLGRGTGLGLSVCYGIVSEHGGRIEVDSTEGVGSTFRVLLPVPPDVGGEAPQKPLRDPFFEMET